MAFFDLFNRHMLIQIDVSSVDLTYPQNKISLSPYIEIDANNIVIEVGKSTATKPNSTLVNIFEVPLADLKFMYLRSFLLQLSNLKKSMRFIRPYILLTISDRFIERYGDNLVELIALTLLTAYECEILLADQRNNIFGKYAIQRRSNRANFHAQKVSKDESDRAIEEFKSLIARRFNLTNSPS